MNVITCEDIPVPCCLMSNKNKNMAHEQPCQERWHSHGVSFEMMCANVKLVKITLQM